MLRTPAPFPQVGSYALLEQDGRHHLVRIVKRTCDAKATIAFPLMPDVASGNRSVDFGQLIDATPLSPFDAREMDRLATALGGDELKGRRRKEAEEREDALRDRIVHAPILADLMKRLPDPTLRASRRAA